MKFFKFLFLGGLHFRSKFYPETLSKLEQDASDPWHLHSSSLKWYFNEILIRMHFADEAKFFGDFAIRVI
jgi:hypothetical protein